MEALPHLYLYLYLGPCCLGSAWTHQACSYLIPPACSLALLGRSMGCGLEGTQAEIDAMLNLTNYHRSLHGCVAASPIAGWLFVVSACHAGRTKSRWLQSLPSIDYLCLCWPCRSPPLVWNDSLAATAKDWSEQCTINHSGAH